MKLRTHFEIQLFAEAAASATAESTANVAADPGNTTGDNKPATATEPKKDEPKYTDADLDRILGKKFAEWAQKKDKEVNEATKLAEMNAQEKAEHFLKQEQEAHKSTQKELDEYKRKDALAAMTKTARKMLSDEGYSISDELLSLLVTTDAEETKTNITGFAKLLTAEVDKAVKEKTRGTTPTVGAKSGVAATKMTKEQILAIKDPELRQQKMLEHKDLFNF